MCVTMSPFRHISLWRSAGGRSVFIIVLNRQLFFKNGRIFILILLILIVIVVTIIIVFHTDKQ
jgi:hypothetical protein